MSRGGYPSGGTPDQELPLPIDAGSAGAGQPPRPSPHWGDTDHWAHVRRTGRRWFASYGHGMAEYSEIGHFAWTEAGIVRKACRFIAKCQADELLGKVKLSPDVQIRWAAPTVRNNVRTNS